MMRNEFIQICNEALKHDTDFDCSPMEPYFQELIALAKLHNHSSEMKNLFIEIIGIVEPVIAFLIL